MTVKIQGRRTGKTTELIRYSNRTGFPIVTSTIQRANMIKYMAKRLQLNIPEPVTFRSMSKYPAMHGRTDRRVLVDDLDSVIAELFRSAGVVPVMAVTSVEGVELEIQSELYEEFERRADGFVMRKGVADDTERISDAVYPG